MEMNMSGASIRFALAGSTLGTILVAASVRGLCAILMGDDPEALKRELLHRFPEAVPATADDATLRHFADSVAGLAEHPGQPSELPLDLRGTAFQQRVWQALREIPPGQTTSYTEIACRIGAPRAARAVANACGANPLALVVPCHRVIHRDGSLSGYYWGVERKRALLAREAGSDHSLPTDL